MKHLFAGILVIGIFVFSVSAQTSERKKLRGVVLDSLTKAPLEGVLVGSGTLSQSITSVKGIFQIHLNTDAEIILSHLGYRTQRIHVSDLSSGELVFYLSPISIKTDEVVVNARKEGKLVESVQTGTVELTKKEILSLPLLLGESDFYKAIKLMPGIQSTGEGNSAVYVRGGGYDQNMILLDEAVVYNPTHLLGFYSVFNSEVIDNATVIKSGIPAEYGNRISSVIKFSTKHAIPEQGKLSGNIGMLATNTSFEAPCFNHRAAVFLAARKTYLNSMLDVARKAKLISTHSMLYKSGYDFYDLNASLIFAPTINDRLVLSSYAGNDLFHVSAEAADLDIKMEWGNQIASLNWYHRFADSLYMDNSLYYSGYAMDMSVSQSRNNLSLQSGISDCGYKQRLTWVLPNQKLRAGWAVVFHQITPNTSKAYTGNTALNMGASRIYYSDEWSLFASDEFQLFENFELVVGGRFNYYRQTGPFADYLRSADGSVVLDTVNYSSGQLVHSYAGPELRFSSRYLINKNNSVKFSYNSNYQYVNLVNVSSISFPTDFWIPATRYIKPQYGNQWSCGYYHFLEEWKIESSVELYYKDFENLIEFNNSIFSTIDNSAIDRSLIYGKGRAYGAEFLFRRSQGAFTGWVGYTLSKTQKKLSEIESGHWFNAKYDRPHNLSVTASYEFSKRWNFSAVFEYASGSTYTPITGRYFVANNVLNQYGRYNSARMPDYHRLDLSATLTLRKTSRLESKLNFSVYNVYNHQNPFFIYPEAKGDIERYSFSVQPREVSIFPILPSVSWIFTY